MTKIDLHFATLAQFNPNEERIAILYGSPFRVKKPNFFWRFVERLFGKPENQRLQAVVEFVNKLFLNADMTQGALLANFKEFVAKLTPKAHLEGKNGWPLSFYLTATPEIGQILERYRAGKEQLFSEIIKAQDTRAFMAMQLFLQRREIETCPARPIERPGKNWPFTSDHPPIGAIVDGFHVASWNTLNPEFDRWIARDTQGLRGSGLDDKRPAVEVPGLTKREAGNVDQIVQMIQRSQLELFHLQECRAAFLDHLQTKLPEGFVLKRQGTQEPDNYNAIIVDTRRFEIKSEHMDYRHPSDPKKPWLALQLRDRHSERTYNFCCVHAPGDPRGSGPEELAESVKRLPQADGTVVMGDMNFEEMRIRSAFGDQALVLSPYATNTFKDSKSPTGFIEKCIDHIVLLGNVEAIPLPLDTLSISH